MSTALRESANHDAIERAGTVSLGLGAGEANQLVRTNIAILRDRQFCFDGKGGIVFQTSDEENSGHRPTAKKSVISVAAIHGHDRSRVQDEGIGKFDIADLAQGVGAAELAKQHRDELSPAGKPLGSPFAAMFLHQCGKLGPGKMLEELIEEAGCLYDCFALLVGDVQRSSGQGTIRQRSL